MQMRPIVDGLQAEFAEHVAFQYLNAGDGANGQQAFSQLNLPGHPAFVILQPDGTTLYRAFGIVQESDLRAAIQAALAR